MESVNGMRQLGSRLHELTTYATNNAEELVVQGVLPARFMKRFLLGVHRLWITLAFLLLHKGMFHSMLRYGSFSVRGGG